MGSPLSIEVQCRARIEARWPAFLARRWEWLRPGERSGRLPEKAAENIVTDLLVDVLDWDRGDVNFQVERSDILLTSKGIKRLLIETKAPGHLRGRGAVERALAQARGYASEQYVKAVGVSDGTLLYVADLLGGAYKDRLLVHLDRPEPHLDLWFASIHGIYRERPPVPQPLLTCLEVGVAIQGGEGTTGQSEQASVRRVGAEARPAECFAFVGDITRPATWKLPYLLASGAADPKRLPMAIGAVLRNYRGRSVKGIPEAAVPEVLFRLGRAAWRTGRFPDQAPTTPAVFRDLQETLLQLGLWDEVRMDEPPAWDQMDRTPGT